MTNSYLELPDEQGQRWIYWRTDQLINRQKAEHRQHEIIAPAPGMHCWATEGYGALQKVSGIGAPPSKPLEIPSAPYSAVAL